MMMVVMNKVMIRRRFNDDNIDNDATAGGEESKQKPNQNKQLNLSDIPEPKH